MSVATRKVSDRARPGKGKPSFTGGRPQDRCVSNPLSHHLSCPTKALMPVPQAPLSPRAILCLCLSHSRPGMVYADGLPAGVG